MEFLKITVAWLVSVLACAVTGSVIQTQFNLAAITALGAPVTTGARLQTTLTDLAGFMPLMAVIAGAGFLPAFAVAGLLSRSRPRSRTGLHTLAGAAAITIAILVMNAVLPMIVIGATRSVSGILALAAAGALGGRVYAALAPSGGRRSMA